MIKEGSRYYAQWVTVWQPDPYKAKSACLQVVGRRIRDSHTVGWPIVFEHEDTRVVSKMLIILNEG